jgi:hypothetical protein
VFAVDVPAMLESATEGAVPAASYRCVKVRSVVPCSCSPPHRSILCTAIALPASYQPSVHTNAPRRLIHLNPPPWSPLPSRVSLQSIQLCANLTVRNVYTSNIAFTAEVRICM